MATRCPACGEFIGDNTFGKHKCGAVINWNAVELASTDPRDAEIARLTALLAEAREGLEFYAKREFFAVMPDDGKTRVVPINNEDGTFAYWLAFVNDDGGQARAILAKLGA